VEILYVQFKDSVLDEPERDLFVGFPLKTGQRVEPDISPDAVMVVDLGPATISMCQAEWLAGQPDVENWWTEPKYV
jgi:hypothetical protein